MDFLNGKRCAGKHSKNIPNDDCESILYDSTYYVEAIKHCVIWDYKYKCWM